jgi:hypothetical protein
MAGAPLEACRDVIAGQDAMHKQRAYLPKLKDESGPDDYKARQAQRLLQRHVDHDSRFVGHAVPQAADKDVPETASKAISTT